MTARGETDVLVDVRNVTKAFPLNTGLLARLTARARSTSTEGDAVRAVDGVTLDVRRGETLGIVGESGCGKTTLGRLLGALAEPDAGTVTFDGEAVADLDADAARRFRRRVQTVFQDPASALNPRMTVRGIVGEPLVVNREARGAALTARVTALLDMVGLKPEHVHRFPHEFSGGQRQRIGIARALALNPDFVVLDEPTSALDVSVQAQVLNLLRDLQARLGLTFVFITHALSVLRHVSDRVAVMYLGRVVEVGPTAGFFEAPRHPYSRALLAAVPEPDPVVERARRRVLLPGEPPSAVDPPGGCRFHPRCPVARDACAWTGERFAARVREKRAQGSVLGDPDRAGWVTDRAGVTLTRLHPARAPEVARAVADVLREDAERAGREFWRVIPLEHAVRVDFEPVLEPVSGRGPRDAHAVACFFPGEAGAAARAAPDRATGHDPSEGGASA